MYEVLPPPGWGEGERREGGGEGRGGDGRGGGKGRGGEGREDGMGRFWTGSLVTGRGAF